MVREGTQRRTRFGFCLDDTKDALLMIQPGNKPEALRAPLKKAGGKTPMLWGTYVVKGDQMEMICEQTSARILLQLKRWRQYSGQPKARSRQRDHASFGR